MLSWRFLVPNSLTAVSLALAIGSMLLSIEGQLALAAWLILWCVLLDKADGTAARLLRAMSRFGSEFDSMADVAAFGIAPALLAYQAARIVWGFSAPGDTRLSFALAGGVYVLLAAVRLARFNATEHRPDERFFEGVPTTLSGAIVSSAVLVCLKYEVSPEWTRFFPVLLALLALGMVSSLPVPKLVLRKSRLLNLFQVTNIVAVYSVGVLMIFPEYVFALALSYVTLGIGVGLCQRSQQESTGSGSGS